MNILPYCVGVTADALCNILDDFYRVVSCVYTPPMSHALWSNHGDFIFPYGLHLATPYVVRGVINRLGDAEVRFCVVGYISPGGLWIDAVIHKSFNQLELVKFRERIIIIVSYHSCKGFSYQYTLRKGCFDIVDVFLSEGWKAGRSVEIIKLFFRYIYTSCLCVPFHIHVQFLAERTNREVCCTIDDYPLCIFH